MSTISSAKEKSPKYDQESGQKKSGMENSWNGTKAFKRQSSRYPNLQKLSKNIFNDFSHAHDIT